MKSFLGDAQLLTTHTLLATCPALNCDWGVRFGRADLADQSKNCRKIDLRYHKVTSVVITNFCRNVKKSHYNLLVQYLEVGWEYFVW